jgi:prephenate dehydrogenase
MKTIGIVGLGVIGGSFAKAIKKFDSEIKVIGIDKNEEVAQKAVSEEVIDSFDVAELKSCELIVICLYPQNTIDYIRENINNFRENVALMDVCGCKKGIVYYIEYILNTEQRTDIDYVSVHPMAGRECWGYENSVDNLFNGKNFLITKTPDTHETAIQKAKYFAEEICKFTPSIITTPEQHDQIIALTSQLAHIVSSAYIKSPTAQYAAGFTGGSFADMTRVANLNEDMWTELFMQNREYLLEELDIFERNLEQFRYAIKGNDSQMLKTLLAKGRERRAKLNQLNVES